MNDDDRDWTTGERAQLEALRLEHEPPQALEGAVIRALTRRSLIQPAPARRRAPWVWMLTPLAAAVLFSGGLFVGSRQGRRAGSPGLPRYLLLLEGADTHNAEEEAQRVVEYRTWARREARAGRLLSGEKLEPEALSLGADSGRPAGGVFVSGFFIIVARDDTEALAIAKGCPQLRRGGRIVIRKIAPT